MDAFRRCLELNPNLPSVRARVQIIEAHPANSAAAPPDDCRIDEMLDSELKLTMDEYDEPQGDDFIFSPLVEPSEADSGYDGLALLFEE